MVDTKAENRPVDTRTLLYYADLLCQKLDLHISAFVERIEAVKARDRGRVEFLEKMALEPLDQQIKYLAGKIRGLFPRGNEDEHRRDS